MANVPYSSRWTGRIWAQRFLTALIIWSLTTWTWCAVPLSGDDQTATWPQWRGPHRDARYQGGPWPASLQGEHLTQRWRVELAPSYSSPIVSQDRVFVTETVDKTTEVVRALDRATGREIWKTQWEGSIVVPFFAASNGSWIRSTPALDGDRLYVAGMRDLLVCLDANTGNKIWEIDFIKAYEAPVPDFGFVSSPIVLGDFVYVQAGASLAKVQKQTGQVVWRVLQDQGGMFGSAFSSPYLVTVQGTPQLLVQTRTTLAGVNPESGEVYWQQEIPAFRGMNILTPTPVGDGIFTSSYGGKSLLLTPNRSDSGWSLQETWTNKAQGYMSTPIVIGDYIYMHLRNRRFVCLDAKTGEEKWTSTPFGEYCSMVANGDMILALDQRGELLLIRANPDKFDVVDRRSIADNTWAHLAVCGNELFVRELYAMTAYEWK
jgi:outer membrane protein assembly factor BamB